MNYNGKLYEDWRKLIGVLIDDKVIRTYDRMNDSHFLGEDSAWVYKNAGYNIESLNELLADLARDKVIEFEVEDET